MEAPRHVLVTPPINAVATLKALMEAAAALDPTRARRGRRRDARGHAASLGGGVGADAEAFATAKRQRRRGLPPETRPPGRRWPRGPAGVLERAAVAGVLLQRDQHAVPPRLLRHPGGGRLRREPGLVSILRTYAAQGRVPRPVTPREGFRFRGARVSDRNGGGGDGVGLLSSLRAIACPTQQCVRCRRPTNNVSNPEGVREPSCT